MARSSKLTAQKRQRERQKSEKAAQKREERAARKHASGEPANQVATPEDLEGYGVPVEPAARRDGDR
jgi:hypothetical protein